MYLYNHFIFEPITDPPREPVRTKKAESQPQKKRKTASISGKKFNQYF